MIDIGLYAAYALVLVALILSLGFPLIYMLKNPKEGKTVLMGIGTVVVVFVLAYVLSSSESFAGIDKFKLEASEIKLIGAGLNTFYVLGVIAIVATVYSEVSSAFK